MSAENKIVFDVETKKQFDEVGGSRNTHLLGVSVAGVYNYADDSFEAFEESGLERLEELMLGASLVIGFNIKHFDYPVLQPYFKKAVLARLPTLDLMEKLEEVVGFRLGLDALAKSTLGEQKSSHGLEALQWFREGRLDEVKKYCLHDVKLTRDLYEYGLKHGSVLFESRQGGLRTVPAGWVAGDSNQIRSILAQAFKNKQVVEIDYVSHKSEDGEEARKKRSIEIYSIKGDTVEAFCHMRQDKRHFKLYRILEARVVEMSHQRPALF
ncbi:MAG: ribonuclease H-like domain-containing protein [Parcubacteria group bacterium]|nr:ribonuclease H-like domain-containing protein [Parcubacteria group bacterium]